MKNNLAIISFVFIFLLTLSNVTGLKELGENCAGNDECASGNCINFCVTPGPTFAGSDGSLTSTKPSSTSIDSSVKLKPLRGFTVVDAADPEVGKCYVQKSASRKGAFKRSMFLGRLFE